MMMDQINEKRGENEIYTYYIHPYKRILYYVLPICTTRKPVIAKLISILSTKSFRKGDVTDGLYLIINFSLFIIIPAEPKEQRTSSKPMDSPDNSYRTCPVCLQIFIKQSHLDSHIKLKHQDKVEGKIGGTTHTCDSDQDQGSKNKTAKEFLCTFCKKSYADKQNLDLHVAVVHKDDRNHSNEKALSCSLCEKHFSSEKKLGRHINAVHKKVKSKPSSLQEGKGEIDAADDKVRSIACPLCNKSFSTKSKLARHKRHHTKEKPFTCSLCNKHFYRKEDVKNHVDAVHKKLKPFSCPKCPQSFAQKQVRDRHVSRKHKTDPTQLSFSCMHCSQSFASQKDLSEHAKLHKDKLFSCSHCDKQFYKKQSVQKHVDSVHKQLRPYLCTVCGKCFAVKWNLTEHLRFHEENKSFSCYLCDKQFYKKQHVNKHIDMVHKKLRPYCCTLCGTSFVDRSGYFRHVRRIHKSVLSRDESELYLASQNADQEDDNVDINANPMRAQLDDNSQIRLVLPSQ